MSPPAPANTLSTQRWALAAALAIMAVWGVNFSVTKYLLDTIGVGPFLFMRFMIMPALGLTLLVAVYRRQIARSWPRREDWPRFIAAGLIGHTVHVSIVTWGVNLSTAFSSSLVLTSGPLFTLLILAALGAEHLRPRQVAGTLVAFAGIVLFLSDKFAAGFSRAGAGDLVLLLAASLFSIYTVIIKPLVARYGPLQVTCYTLFIGAPPIVLATLPSFAAIPLAQAPLAIWPAMFWAAAISAFLGWLVWTWVNAVRGIARSAPLQYLMPPIAGLAAWLMLGETFTWLKIAGAGVTLIGIAWAQFGGGHAPPKEAAQPDSG